MEFDGKTLSDFTASSSLEWLETNGVGGYASSTLAGANTRRYHGLLVAATLPPVGRMVVVSKLEETIKVDEKKYPLSSNQYPGAIHPQGYTFLERFEHDLFPVFYYQTGEIRLKKTIVAVHGENTTLVLYEVLEGDSAFEIEFLPLYACRDFHSLSRANDFIGHHYLFDEGVFRTLNYHKCPEFFISIPGSDFTDAKGWYHNFEYPVEQERGMDYREDLYTHGKFSVTLQKGERLGVIISTEDPIGRDAFQLFELEKKRRQELVKNFSWDHTLKQLVLSGDQFIVKRGSRHTIVAGYHWFSDWGRDTMISLPGLCLVTGRYDEAKSILLQFSESVSEGMLPNRFPDSGEAPEYNTVDATLWFFQAIFQYYKSTGDKAFLQKVLPVLKEILDWHYNGTRYGIQVDPADELLYGGRDGVQLTWMDAKVGDWIVTPRKGKVVEINALWYNALSIMAFFADENGRVSDAITYRSKAKRVADSFNSLFWNELKQCLYDYVDGEYRNDQIRPNQLYAISLPFVLLSKERGQKVFETVTSNLLTPKGLRSLSPTDKDYKPFYVGDIWSRDGSYHQGTVWGFLIGVYVDAMFYVSGDEAKPHASKLIQEFLKHLKEAGVGTLSEIFDATSPHSPRGCMAQAWSVAETLRVATVYNLIERQVKEQQMQRQ